MNFEKYAGMASAVGIVLILMMIAWLGIWGPVDIGKLQPWQTLLTGFLAVIAAIIAYAGATAKVRFDRHVAEQEKLTKKVALFRRLAFSLENIVRVARNHRNSMSGKTPRKLTPTELAFPSHPEFDEAWERLD